MSMRPEITICYRESFLFRELAEALAVELGGRGRILPDDRLVPSDTEILWLLGNLRWFPRVLREIETLPVQRRPL